MEFEVDDKLRQHGAVASPCPLLFAPLTLRQSTRPAPQQRSLSDGTHIPPERPESVPSSSGQYWPPALSGRPLFPFVPNHLRPTHGHV